LYTVYIQTLSNVFIHSVEVECEIWTKKRNTTKVQR
jgi:hypothetical protein